MNFAKSKKFGKSSDFEILSNPLHVLNTRNLHDNPFNTFCLSDTYFHMCTDFLKTMTHLFQLLKKEGKKAKSLVDFEITTGKTFTQTSKKSIMKIV